MRTVVQQIGAVVGEDKHPVGQAGFFGSLRSAAFVLTAFLVLAAGEMRGAETLRISEIMYHPSPPTADEVLAGFADEDAFEFIEIQNTGTLSVNLSSIAFTDGITFNFSAGSVNSLAPGDHAVVVRNAAAFDFRYGTGINVAGEYAGKLSNGGESVMLRGATGDILRFSYDDDGPGWHRSTDGDGFSLVIVDATAPASTWGHPSSWRPSSLPGGTPGEADTAGGVIISEIMYHPSTNPGSPAFEYIELHNRGGSAVDLEGWRFDSGVTYTFPNGASIPANGHLVIASGVASFQTRYPGVTNVVGGWTGQLSDKGEKLELVDAAGHSIDQVHYSDQGNWADRRVGPEYEDSSGTIYTGWEWYSDHDGTSNSLELINMSVPNEHGRYWSASSQAFGTPGASNSVSVGLSAIAPVILDVEHYPEIATSTQTVTITATVIRQTPDPATVRVYHRVDDSGAGFSTMNMVDDGSGQDVTAGDGVYTAVLPAEPHGTIVEFYVHAEQGGIERTWPAAVIPTGQQEANCLYQVLDVGPASVEVATDYMIMTAAEREKLDNIWANDAWNQPLDALMNVTFISVEEAGFQVRYLTGARNRGSSARTRTPHSFHVNFRHDERWHNRTGININTSDAWRQHMGAVLYRMAGLEPQDAWPSRLRVNGVDLSDSGSSMYGTYVSLEHFGTDYVKNHFPTNVGGNLYKINNGGRFKQTNEEENDWTDIGEMDRVVAISPAVSDYLMQVGEWINVDQWLTYIAFDTLMGNTETGPATGRWTDDFSLYSGMIDRRFVMIPRDLDAVMEGSATRDIFAGYEDASGLKNLLDNAEVRSMYYQKLRALIDDVYNNEVLDPVLDRELGPYVPAAQIQICKDFISNRRASVISQLNTYSPPEINGVLVRDLVIDAATGPWRVTGPATVGNGVELTIRPGATVIFEGSYGITVTGTGRIAAEGNAAHPITLQGSGGSDRVPLAFIGSMEDNRLCHVNMNFSDIGVHYLDFQNSRALLDHCVLTGSESSTMDIVSSAVILRDCVFPSAGDNEGMHISGTAPNGYLIFSGNTFPANRGRHDLFDITGTGMTGAPVYFFNNTFLGGEDDGIDVDGGGAHIEGNSFRDFTIGTSTHTSTRNGIAVDVGTHVKVIRNVFYGNQHDILVKGGATIHAVHNTFVGAEQSAVSFREGSTTGESGYMDGNIFWDAAADLGSPEDTTSLTVNTSRIASAFHSYGTGNINTDPLLENPAGGDFSLKTGSPCIGTGPGGKDMGAMVPVEQPLRISEIMYNPPDPTPTELAAGHQDSDQFEFIEIMNSGTEVQYLAGLRFVEGVQFEFYRGSVHKVDPGEHVLVVSDPVAFEARYGTGLNVAGAYTGNLANDGERLTLLALSGDTIHDFHYHDGWYPATDGKGRSLVIAEPSADLVTQLWALKQSWRASAAVNGSPGAAESGGHIPGIVINEILTHTDDPLRDAIELHNPTFSPVNVGGWYLTDNAGMPKKFRIPDGTTLPVGGSHVIYEGHYSGTNLLFNPDEFGSGFSLSSLGDEVYLFSPDLSYYHGFEFDGAFNGVSFGRYVTTTGKETFPSLVSRSLPGVNSGPRNGPVVISEIMYHPAGGGDEFVELANVSDSPVKLYDPLNPTNTWRVSGMDFRFPQNAQLEPGELCVLVWDSISPTAFRAKYNVSVNVEIFNFSGRLQNDGEDLKLMQPDEPLMTGPNAGKVAEVVIDRVDYRDGGAWPVGADGLGPSLERRNPEAYGNEPENWTAGNLYGGTPGILTVTGDQPLMALDKTEITLNVEPGNDASARSFQVWNAGKGTLNYTVSESADWLTVSPQNEASDGVEDKNVHLVNFQTTSLAEGTYRHVVTVASVDAPNSPLAIDVTLNVMASPDFNAYNDFSWTDGQLTSNITRYTTDTGTGNPPDGSSGPLKNHASGEDVPVILSVSGGNWSGSLHASQGAEPASGTDASSVFNGKLSCEGVISYGSGSTTVTLSQCDPEKSYTLVLYANRDRYSDRNSKFTISDVASFINESSSGAMRSTSTLPDDSVTIVADNTANGYVANYTGVRCGNDGDILVTISGVNPYLSSMMLSATAPGILDGDNDLMDDGWETAFFGSTNNPNGDADYDFDQDGLNTLEEYLAGSNPTNAASCLKIEEILHASETDLTVTWQSFTGKVYSVMSTTDLPTNWTPLHSGMVATPPRNSATVTVTNHNQFFRVQQE